MTLFRCEICGHTLFPARLVCPACGSSAWGTVDCETGRIEATTAIHRDGEATVHLATVRTPPGVIVLAQLSRASLAGDVILRERPDGALIAQALEEQR